MARNNCSKASCSTSDLCISGIVRTDCWVKAEQCVGVSYLSPFLIRLSEEAGLNGDVGALCADVCMLTNGYLHMCVASHGMHLVCTCDSWKMTNTRTCPLQLPLNTNELESQVGRHCSVSSKARSRWLGKRRRLSSEERTVSVLCRPPLIG